jgi:MFS transporter, OFA family, oxalate/formate antiporter
MAEEKVFNRWLVVLGAMLIQVSLGAVYIYSVFKPSLALRFPTWSATDLALPSQVILAFFALGVTIAGRIQDKMGPKKVAMAGGIMLGAGLILASRMETLTMFTLCFSVLGGLGIGTAYVCPLATCVKWFPDMRGLITGLAVAGFGAGALVFTPVAKALVAATGIMPTFMWLGVIFLVAVLLGSMLMILPPPGFKPAGWNPPEPAAGAAAAAASDFTWQEMLKTSQFWILWLTYFAGCTAGLMIIMNVLNIWQSVSILGIAKGTSLVPRATFEDITSVGATAIMVVAILNASGRIAWGKISDNLGRKTTLLIMFTVCGATMLCLNFMTSFALFITGVSIVGFCFGGFLALYPAVTADYFGTKNMGANYGWMFLAFGGGGLFGPWLAPKLQAIVAKVPYEAMDKGTLVVKQFAAGSFLNAFVTAGIMCLVSVALVWIVKPPTK